MPSTPMQMPPTPLPTTPGSVSRQPSFQQPIPTPPPSPPASGLSRLEPIVPPAHGSYPSHPLIAGGTRKGFALQASYAAHLNTDSQKRIASNKLLPSKDAGPVAADPLPSEWWVLRRFIHETCMEAPGTLYAHIDLENTLDPNFVTSGGTTPHPHMPDLQAPLERTPAWMLGFRQHLYAWCRQRHRGLPLPSLQGSDWASALPEGVRFVDQLRVRHVLGLEWVPIKESWMGPGCSIGWLIVEAIEVIIHVGVFILIPMTIAYYALDMQRAWARMLCLPSTIGTEMMLSPAASVSLTYEGLNATLAEGSIDCNLWSGFAPLHPKLPLIGGASPLPIVGFVVTWTNLLAFISVLRLIFGYLHLPLFIRGSSKMMSGETWSNLAFPIMVIHGLFVSIGLALGFTAVGMILAWSILGGATHPAAALPLYALVTAMLAVLYGVGVGMHRASRRLRARLLSRFMHVLQPYIQRAHRKSQLQLALQRSAAVGKHLALPNSWDDVSYKETPEHLEHYAERQSLLEQQKHLNRPPIFKSNVYPHTDDVEAVQSAMIHGLADDPSRASLQPMDIYLILAGDGRRPLRVEDFRPRFESLELPLTVRQKEVLYSQVEMERERELAEIERKSEYHIRHLQSERKTPEALQQQLNKAVSAGYKVGGSHSILHRLRSAVGGKNKQFTKRELHERHPYVTARQFCDGWEAMEQGLLRRGLIAGGVAATQIVRTVGLSLGVLAALLVFLTVGKQGLRTSNDLAEAIVTSVVVLGCALLVIAFRPKARAETQGVEPIVEEIIADDLSRAAED